MKTSHIGRAIRARYDATLREMYSGAKGNATARRYARFWAAVVRRRARQVHLTEVPAESRPRLLKAYLQQVPGARPHLPVKHTQPVADFEAIAQDYPIFYVEFLPDHAPS